MNKLDDMKTCMQDENSKSFLYSRLNIITIIIIIIIAVKIKN